MSKLTLKQQRFADEYIIGEVLLNTSQIYLICTNKIDKRESAKLLLKLNRILLSKLLDLELFNLDELVRWSKWRNMQNG